MKRQEGNTLNLEVNQSPTNTSSNLLYCVLSSDKSCNMFQSFNFLVVSTTLALAQSGPENAVFRSGTPWFDTTGARMYVGGANIYQENGVFYLVGEGKKVLSGDCSSEFTFYNSTDLVNWNPLPSPLQNKDIVAPSGFSYPFRMERPKIFKCPTATSSPYRLVFHCDSPSFSMKSIGVLSADSVTGPYTFVSPCYKPDGEDSYDMGTFVDNERGGSGKAYLVRSVQNQYAGISAFNDNCTFPTGIISSGPDCEGQAIMRDSNGTLHLMGSHLTGWAANAAQFVTTSSPVLENAQWVNNYNPSGDSTTWDSQSTFIFPYTHADGHTTFIYMGDRWNGDNKNGGLANMTNIWLPLIPPSGGKPPSPSPGWVMQLDTCNPSSSNQIFSLANNQVVHVSSGLCVQSNGNNQLTLATCTQGDDQTWNVEGNNRITNGKKNGNCIDFNNANNVVSVGNPIIGWECGSPAAWNEEWKLPSSNNGVLTAIGENGSPSSFCASVSPANDPNLWSIPWLDSWRLGDY